MTENQTVGVTPKIEKTHLLYWVIAVLILIIFGKTLFASDDDRKKDALTAIDTQITELNAYKQKVSNELKTKVDTANEEILKQCAEIPESLKSWVKCWVFLQENKLPEPTVNNAIANEIKNWTSTGGIAPVPSQSSKIDEHTLREFLNIPDCETRELNFNTKHKLPRYNLEWLAYDIPPCVKGEVMKVYSPNYWDTWWIIEKIDRWTNMGNYAILRLKGSDIRVVYAHTVVNKALLGQAVSPLYEIGYTDLSWETKWMHLHVEIWQGSSIVSKHIFWSDDYTKQDESSLLKHRNWDFVEKNKEVSYWKTYEKSISLLHKWEGLRLKAYPDYKGCSIWYGSRATSCDEVITQAEANRRLAYVVRDLTEKVQDKFPTLTEDGQSALVSFAYNCHQWWVDVQKNWLWQHKLWCKHVTVDWEKKYLDSLIDRRAEEQKLIFETGK